jgi:hypothetical protein
VTGSGVNAVFAASPSVEEAVAVDMARRCARACVNDRVITGIDQGVSSLAPGVADLRVACVLTSRLDDMSWSYATRSTDTGSIQACASHAGPTNVRTSADEDVRDDHVRPEPTQTRFGPEAGDHPGRILLHP